MLLDIKRKLGFVHIPHTAGNVVNSYFNLLSSNNQWDDDFEWLIRKDLRLEIDPEYGVDLEPVDHFRQKAEQNQLDPGHVTYKHDKPNTQDYHWLHDQIYNYPSYFVKHQRAQSCDQDMKLWTIIRNPYDRLITDYFNMLTWVTRNFKWVPTTGKTSKLDYIAMVDNRWSYVGMDMICEPDDIKTFEKYMKWKSKPRPNQWDETFYLPIRPHGQEEFYASEFSAEKVKHYLFDRDQTYFTHDDNQNDLIDTYIRYENLKEDYNNFAQTVGYPKNIFDLKINWTTPHIYAKRHYSHFYTDETKELADKFCLRDCKTYGYEFEWK